MNINEQLDRAQRLRFVAALAIVLAVVLTLAIVTTAQAAPIAQAKVEGVTITLYDEPCKVHAVANLQMRATWIEGGATHEGCWGASPLRLVMLYFETDRTVAAVPITAFARLTQS